MLDALLPGVQQALGENLAGVYLRGSLALGDFDPLTSDLDFLAVTERPVTDSEFRSLADLHAQLAQSSNRYARRLEGSYIPRAAVRRFPVGGRRHPTLGTDWAFGWGEHRDNWILELWTVRERGVVLWGPDPRTLIAPISADQLREAVRSELTARLRDWAAQPEGPEWLLPRFYQAFEVQTMCRALYTLAHGTLPTKPRAVAWALGILPEPWHTLVERTRAWHTEAIPDPTGLAEVLRFVRWAASDGEAAVIVPDPAAPPQSNGSGGGGSTVPASAQQRK